MKKGEVASTIEVGSQKVQPSIETIKRRLIREGVKNRRKKMKTILKVIPMSQWKALQKEQAEHPYTIFVCEDDQRLLYQLLFYRKSQECPHLLGGGS